MEKWLNVLVGSTLINNFYYLSFFVGVDYSVVIIVCGLISVIFFLKSVLFYKNAFSYLFQKSALTAIIFTLVFLSIFFFIINPHTAKEVDFNDIIRITILFFYFGWTGMTFGSHRSLPNLILTLSIFSIFISFFACFFEYNFPGVFGIIFTEERSFDETTWIHRIAGTIRDPNAFSCIIIIYSFFIYYYLLKFKTYWLSFTYLICLFWVINLTGSRQGLLLFLILSGYILYSVRLSIKGKVYVFLILSLLVTIIAIKGLTSTSEVDSVIVRVFQENEHAKGSNEDRIRSIFDGVIYSFDNYYCLYGPGGILFNKFWEKSHNELSQVPPHNAIIFLFTQFGLFSFLIYIGIFHFFRLTFTKKMYIIGGIFFLTIIFLPSILYTGVSLILVWFIDVHNVKALPNAGHS